MLNKQGFKRSNDLSSGRRQTRQVGRRDGDLADEARVKTDVLKPLGLGRIGVQTFFEPPAILLALRRAGQIIGPDGLGFDYQCFTIRIKCFRHSTAILRTVERKRHYLGDRFRAGGQHHQPVESHRHAHRRRQTRLHRRQQAVPFRQCGFSFRLPLGVGL